MAGWGTGLKREPNTPFLPLQTMNVQHCPNRASEEVFLNTGSILFDALLGTLAPHNPALSASPLPLARLVLVTSLCSWHQGQGAHVEVWSSQLGFYQFLLLWPVFDALPFCDEPGWQEQGVIASKQRRLSEPLTLWSKEQSCLLTVRKNGDAWSIISRERTANGAWWAWILQACWEPVSAVFGFISFLAIS